MKLRNAFPFILLTFLFSGMDFLSGVNGLMCHSCSNDIAAKTCIIIWEAQKKDEIEKCYGDDSCVWVKVSGKIKSRGCESKIETKEYEDKGGGVSCQKNLPGKCFCSKEKCNDEIDPEETKSCYECDESTDKKCKPESELKGDGDTSDKCTHAIKKLRDYWCSLTVDKTGKTIKRGCTKPVDSSKLVKDCNPANGAGERDCFCQGDNCNKDEKRMEEMMVENIHTMEEVKLEGHNKETSSTTNNNLTKDEILSSTPSGSRRPSSLNSFASISSILFILTFLTFAAGGIIVNQA